MAGDKTDLLYNAYFTSTLADQGVHYGYQITHGCIMLRYCSHEKKNEHVQNGWRGRFTES